MKYLLLLLFTLSIGHRGYGQNDNNDRILGKPKYLSYFGLQFKPLFATNFITASQLKLIGNELTADYRQKFGFTFGGNVRVGLSKVVNLETGLNFVQRNYDINFDVHSVTTNMSAKTQFRIIAYDLPVNALFYIKLSNLFYMNASLGASLGYLPTNVWKTYVINSFEKFSHEGRRFSHFYGAANANVGFEMRTQKIGFFYLGASIQVPFKPIFQIAAAYKRSGHNEVLYGNVSGSYITFDVRYYFKNNNERKSINNRGPIEQ